MDNTPQTVAPYLMQLTYVALAVCSLCWAMLGVASVIKGLRLIWLNYLTAVMALMAVFHFVEVTSFTQPVDGHLMLVINLVMSALSTYSLSEASLLMLDRRAPRVQLALVGSTALQGATFLFKANDPILNVFMGLDLATCLACGLLVAAALWTSFAKKADHNASLWGALGASAGIVWAVADAGAYLPDAQQVVKTIAIVGMNLGALGVSIAATILAARDGETIARTPVPVGPNYHPASARAMPPITM